MNKGTEKEGGEGGITITITTLIIIIKNIVIIFSNYKDIYCDLNKEMKRFLFGKFNFKKEI